MIYGLSGASGVGKTTVGKLVADSLDIQYISGSITEMAKRHGYDAVGNLNLADRFELQKKLLGDHIEMLDTFDAPVIIDRTPIDMIGYMMGEIYMSSYERLTKKKMDEISEYVSMCQEVASTRFDFIFHLKPLEFYEQAATRPASNPAYQRHTDLIMRGALFDAPEIDCAIINTTDLNERQEFIHDHIVNRLNEIETLRASHPKLH